MVISDKLLEWYNDIGKEIRTIRDIFFSSKVRTAVIFEFVSCQFKVYRTCKAHTTTKCN
jgi:hypothetical protein